MSTVLRLPQIAITLADGTAPERVQLLKVGTYHDPRYGKFQITKKLLASMKDNFDNKVLKIDPAIDFAHKSDLEAAAWIKGVELSADKSELWAVVEWTPDGAKALSDKKYRYLSADFTENYIDNETLKEYGPTLRGAGLTNRPVIKGMDAAVQLQEGITNMKTIEEVEAERAALEVANKKLAEEKTALEVQLAAKKAADDKEPDADDEGDDTKDMPPAAKKKFLAMKKQLEEQMAEKKCAEQKADFDKKLSEGKVVEAQRAAFMSGDFGKFMELAQAVNLNGKGDGREPVKPAGDVDTRIVKAAEKILSEKKASDMGQAISKVLAENIDGLRVEKHGK